MTEPRDVDDRHDDLLAQATRALREGTKPSERDLADGRAVLLWAQRSANRQKSRGRTLRWVLPLAAVLTAGTALAASSGQLEWVAQAVERCADAVSVAAPKPKRARVERKAAPAVAVPSPALREPAADAATEPAATAAPAEVAHETPESEPVKPVGAWKPKPQRSAEQRAARVIAASEPLPPPALEDPGPVPSADLAAYRKAHALHFRTRDFRGALAAWDAYLAEHPQGTFALEALYNRAICLVRLDRIDEAKKALAPFAQGAMQNRYRQREATELLEALE